MRTDVYHGVEHTLPCSAYPISIISFHSLSLLSKLCARASGSCALADAVPVTRTSYSVSTTAQLQEVHCAVGGPEGTAQSAP